jgi:hypothetical protein
MKLFSIVLFAVFAVLFFSASMSGCMQPPTPPSSIAPLDSGERVAVKASIKTDPELASQPIDVSVINKEATLTGTVASEEQKKRAEELALKTSGIIKVVNKLEVIPENN